MSGDKYLLEDTQSQRILKGQKVLNTFHGSSSSESSERRVIGIAAGARVLERRRVRTPGGRLIKCYGYHISSKIELIKQYKLYLYINARHLCKLIYSI